MAERFAINQAVDAHLSDHSATDLRRAVDAGAREKMGYGLAMGGLMALGRHMPLNGLSSRKYERTEQAHRLFDVIRAVSNRPIVVHSSKAAVRMAALYTHQPDSMRFIYLTGDGRGWLNSQLKRQIKYGPMKVTRAVKAWKKSHYLAKVVLGPLPASSYLHVRYEEIARQPEETLCRICHFVGIEFTPMMLAFWGQEHHNLGGNPVRFDKGGRTIVEDVRWRELLNDIQLQELEKAAGGLNRRILGDCYVS